MVSLPRSVGEHLVPDPNADLGGAEYHALLECAESVEGATGQLGQASAGAWEGLLEMSAYGVARGRSGGDSYAEAASRLKERSPQP